MRPLWQILTHAAEVPNLKATNLVLDSPAPDFRLPSLGGAIVSLADFRGRSVLLVFLRHLG